MPTLNMTVGNIGCGKSFLSSKLSKMFDAIVVNNDSLVSMIGGGEYSRYDVAKKEVYQKTEDTLIESSLKAGFSVVIDRTNMGINRRKRFIEIGQKYASEIVCYDFGPGNSDCLDRRIEGPRGVPKATWESVYSYMKDSYEKPTMEEGFSDIVVPPEKYEFHAFDFDGTIVDNKFPEIGEQLNGTVDLMNKIYRSLSSVIIVWTCRSGDYLNQMRDFIIKERIPFDFINKNPIVNFGSPKIYAHKYYDDRNQRF